MISTCRKYLQNKTGNRPIKKPKIMKNTHILQQGELLDTSVFSFGQVPEHTYLPINLIQLTSYTAWLVNKVTVSSTGFSRALLNDKVSTMVTV